MTNYYRDPLVKSLSPGVQAQLKDKSDEEIKQFCLETEKKIVLADPEGKGPNMNANASFLDREQLHDLYRSLATARYMLDPTSIPIPQRVLDAEAAYFSKK